MKLTSSLVSLAFSVTTALAFSSEDVFFYSLLKRQEPGTPAYECHNSCGTAITASRGPDPCNDDGFLSNYAACLACAAPEDQNIWQYYGATLTTAGTKCGLSTTPGEDGGSGETSSSSSTVAGPTETSTAPPETTTSTSTTKTESVLKSTTAATTTSGIENTTDGVPSSTAVGTTTPGTYTSGSGGLNSTSSSIPFTNKANTIRNKSFIVIGIVSIIVLRA